MTTQIAQYDAGFKYNQDQIDLIKNTIAKGATDDELAMFTAIAQKYNLDPLIKEIWFIKRAKKVKNTAGDWDYKRDKAGNIDYTGAETLIMTSRDGYLKVAQRDDNFDGIISFAVREGDIFEIDAENYKVSHKFGAKRGPIIGAWAKVDHKKRRPVIVFCDFREYNDAKSTTWQKYPTAMIMKVAETLALKRQFGISGLVTREEMTGVYEQEGPVFDTTLPPAPAPAPVPVEKPKQEPVVEIVEDDPKATKIITPDQAKHLYTLAGNNLKLVKAVVTKSGYKSTADIAVDDYENICLLIEAQMKGAKANEQG